MSVPNDFMGREFIWWVGVVEDRNDPLFLGRVKIRCLGWHTKDKSRMPTSSLPWAMPMQPTTSAAQTQVGQTPLGLVEGSWVLGFFQDGEEAQYPIVLGSLGGFPEELNKPSEGFNDPRPAVTSVPYARDEDGELIPNKTTSDTVWPTMPYSVNLNAVDAITSLPAFGPTIVEYGDEGAPARPAYPNKHYLFEPTTNRLARGTKDKSAKIRQNEDFEGATIVQWKDDVRVGDQRKAKPPSKIGEDFVEPPTWAEPVSPYNAQYPYNHVHQSESGHITEIDDTPGAERLNWHHRAGTFTEIHPDGKKVSKTAHNVYDIVYGHNHQLVKRSKYTNIDRSYQLHVNQTDTVGGDYYVRVGAGGNIVWNTVRGDITSTSSGGTITSTAKNIVLKAQGDIDVTAKNINFTYKNFVKTVEGNEKQRVTGASENSADVLTMSGDKEVRVSTKTLYQTAGVSSIEEVRPTLSATLNLTESNAKLVRATFGTIQMNSINNIPVTGSPDDGGIVLNHGLKGAGASITLDDLGDVTINSILGTKGFKAVVGSGATAFETTLGNETHALGAGNFTVEATTGDVGMEATAGKITMDSGSAIEATTKGTVNVEATGAAVFKGANATIDGQQVYLVDKSKEPIILGNKFVKDFVRHQHATGTGPSGPVTDSTPYTNHLSKKVFSG
jgi:hypothetical protein